MRNQSGLRTSKTVAGNTVRYTWIGDKITSEVGNGNALYFYYDSNNTPVAVMLNGTLYYYVTNLQGDIIAMLDETGTAVVEYSYDAWGNTTITGTLKNTVGRINPLRYRGYYYDTDIGLYYLQSRYYDANIGRFINADTVVSVLKETTNLFSYCNNDFVNGTDPAGKSFKSITRFLVRKIVANRFFVTATQKGWFKDLFWLAGFTRDKKGVYHARQDCVQQYFGYNDLYDFFFDLGTYMSAKKFKFVYNSKDYILWAWKGDYLNLGAGAELGIYKRLVINGYKTEHWLAQPDLAMNMRLSLLYKGKRIITYRPKEKVWWITGFNPYYQNVNIKKLTAIINIYFTSRAFYNAFKKYNYGYLGVNFVDKYKVVTITF